MRSSLGDWAVDNGFSTELVERCLAHVVGDTTTRAYVRTDQLDERRKLLDAWGRFATGIDADNVVALAGRRR